MRGRREPQVSMLAFVDLDARVPEGIAARIHTDAGVASVDVDEGRFPKVGDYYQSPGYEAAARRVALKIKGGVADISVR